MKKKEIEKLPRETQNVVRRLIKKGYVINKNNKVELTDEMANLLLILDRADVFN